MLASEPVIEKNMEKSDIIVVGICVIMLFMWFDRMNERVPKPPGKPGVEQVDGSDTEVGVAGTGPETVPDAGTGTDNGSEGITAPQQPDPVVPEGFAGLQPADPIVLKSEKVALTIDPEKGGIIKAEMTGFTANQGDGVLEFYGEKFPFLAVHNATGNFKFSRAKVEREETRISVSRAVLNTPFVLRQVWALVPDKPYRIDYRAAFINTAQIDSVLPELKLDCGTMVPTGGPTGFMGAAGIDQRVSVMIDEKVEDEMVPKVLGFKPKHVAKYKQSPVDWIAIQDKYFASVVNSDMHFTGTEMVATPIDKAGKKEPHHLTGYVFIPSVTIAAGETKQWEFDYFIGPKTLSGLKDYGDGAEAILNFDLFILWHFGWMSLISRGILWLITALFAFVGSWGVAIIITTFIVRFSFWPITHQSTMLSRKMQKVQPLVMELKEKYKDDPQKLQQKTFELYREHKINVLAGCLPVLFQIPVFFALFNVLRSAIELRQTSFLWAADLAAPDTLSFIKFFDVNPLAITCGLSMFIQQRCMPSSADPMQQKMMLFMTCGLFFVFYSMPSGLTLYWTISNCISIFQYQVIKRTYNPESEAGKDAAPAAA
jgi:YidC/Oxa1 family membrane protein insertase